MITDTQMAEAENILGHPLGKRKTDDKLAMAAVLGHLGRPRRSDPRAILKSSGGPLTDGLELAMYQRRGSFWQRAMNIFRAPAVKTRRRWPLLRALQVDQNGFPECVGATEQHWELSQPIQNRRGLGFREMYRRAKLIDGYPSEDGTWAWAMLEVCKQIGIVESDWWWTGPQDTEAASDWLLNIGPMWVGWYLPESAFRTDAKGMVEIAGEFRYGHEMLLIERDVKRKLWGGVQSWGRGNYGVDGRWWVRDEDFDRLMAADGDLCGVVERRL